LYRYTLVGSEGCGLVAGSFTECKLINTFPDPDWDSVTKFVTAKCPEGTKGRYVYAQQRGTGGFHNLAEIQVAAQDIPTTPAAYVFPGFTGFTGDAWGYPTCAPWFGPNTDGGGKMVVNQETSYTFSDTNFVYVIADVTTPASWDGVVTSQDIFLWGGTETCGGIYGGAKVVSGSGKWFIGVGLHKLHPVDPELESAWFQPWSL
jgi:hypothetical protein